MGVINIPVYNNMIDLWTTAFVFNYESRFIADL